MVSPGIQEGAINKINRQAVLEFFNPDQKESIIK
jgi:hypothetical protein